jgi:predicted small metal-binding protein
MRVMLCASLYNHDHSPRAADDEELVEIAFDHLKQHHPTVPLPVERVREIVSACPYDLEEYAEVYAGVIEPDEEFGPEPY